uniref:Protein FAM160A1-like n=1 Tax=Cynoglossus semilaevis TaxID=244447 RepID=A0A3P8UXT5_CYNSE
MMTSVVLRGIRKKSLTLRGVDPETCMIVFKNHWTQVLKILEKHEPGRSSVAAFSFLSGHSTSSSSGGLRLGPIPADEASAVQNYVEHMLFLLMEEEAEKGGAMGPILEFVVLEGVLERLFLWSLRRQFTEDMKLEQLRMYQMLLTQGKQPLLHHKPVLRPLMMLLASCAEPGADSGGDGGVVEAELVLLLKQLCVSLVKDSSVLELFFHTSEDQGATNFLIFSLLIPYKHRQGSVGQQARDALLLIMSLSASEPRVAQHISHNTYFCPVLATGLSGLYSSLPARLQVYSEDWNFLEQADWQQVPALVHFLHSLDFCGAVTKVAHPSISSQLLGYIHEGFLVPVLAPALHKLTLEEVMTTTAYLDLFLRSITEPALLQTFLSFILLHTHDNVHILDTLVSRVNTPFQLGTVSLALFRTLIGLFCEDVMLQLVFRYLIPCSHLSRKQRCTLHQRDCYSTSAATFLLLIPSLFSPSYSQSTDLNSDHIHWPKGSDLISDSVGYCRGSDLLSNVNYHHYLCDARQAITVSQRACRLWSAPYDGVKPPPEGYLADPPEDEEEIILRLKRDSICSLVMTPPPTPTSSSDTMSTGNHTGRTSSALELEWDDIFTDEDPAPSLTVNHTLVNGNGVTFGQELHPHLPPQHIQEMQRNAIKLVCGSYVEESEFQDDVLVYDLVAKKDTKVVILEQMSQSQQDSQQITSTITRMLTKTHKSVKESVNNIMWRRSDDVEKEDGEEKNNVLVSLDTNAHIINICDDAGKDKQFLKESFAPRNFIKSNNFLYQKHGHHNSQHLLLNPALSNSSAKSELHSTRNTFLCQYQELMLSLGVDPDLDDNANDISSFRRRVRALRQKLEEEDEGLGEEAFVSWSSDEDKEDALIEEEEEEEGEMIRRHEVPLTESVESHAGDVLLEQRLPNGTVRSVLTPPPAVVPPCPQIPQHAKSRVFAIVLYAEFLKELAGVAQEHSIASDCPDEEEPEPQISY